MLTIDIYSRVPIYQQVIDGIKNLILLGVLRENEQIPSVRELSVTVNTNPNTVSKAYLELERSGFLNAAVGKGYFVAVGAPEHVRAEIVGNERTNFVQAAERLYKNGVPKEELEKWLSEIYGSSATQAQNEKEIPQ